MKKNGFTLIELMVVILLIGFLMIITVPNIVKVSKNTKEQAYLTKIDIIEAAARDFGDSNKSQIAKGINPLSNEATNSLVILENIDDKTGKVGNINYQSNVALSSDENYGTDGRTYRGIRLTVKELADNGVINYDNKNQCETCGTEKDYYNDTLNDPTNNYIINQCYVYIYYKYERVYATFDRTTCDQKEANYNELGREYTPKKN